MTTKEQELKKRLVSVLQDMRADAKKDPEAFWLIGSLATTLIDKAKAPSWPALKDALTREAYDELLGDFQTTGNKLYQDGETRRAYAMQALGLSLVCLTQRNDPVIRDGEILLDSVIAGAVAIYRKTQRTN